MSDGRVVSKSDFIIMGTLTNHLMRGKLDQKVKKGQNSSDVIYGGPLIFKFGKEFFTFEVEDLLTILATAEEEASV